MDHLWNMPNPSNPSHHRQVQDAQQLTIEKPEREGHSIGNPRVGKSMVWRDHPADPPKMSAVENCL